MEGVLRSRSVSRRSACSSAGAKGRRSARSFAPGCRAKKQEGVEKQKKAGQRHERGRDRDARKQKVAIERERAAAGTTEGQRNSGLSSSSSNSSSNSSNRHGVFRAAKKGAAIAAILASRVAGGVAVSNLAMNLQLEEVHAARAAPSCCSEGTSKSAANQNRVGAVDETEEKNNEKLAVDENPLNLRGGFEDEFEGEDFDFDDDDDEMGMGFDVNEEDLREIGKELKKKEATTLKIDENEENQNEAAIIAQLTELTDPTTRRDPYPWEGLNTKWMNDPETSVVLSPDDRDGHQYLLEVKRDQMTGEELSGTLALDLQKGGKIDAKKLQEKYTDKLLVQTQFRPDKLRDMTYSQFWCLVEEGQIQKARFTYDKRSMYVTTKTSAPGGQRTELLGIPPDPQLMDHLTTHGVFVEEPRDLSVLEDLLLGIARIGIPTTVGLALFYASSKIGLLAEDKTSSFETVDPTDIETNFKDVAGIDIIKNEVQEVVEFLRQPKRFLEMGIRTPAGVLLVGLPGTGKTLLARAVAAEANVPLINCSGAEFVDEYVGMGAAKIRDLFEMAREKAPCVIFIDEFDGLGKARTGGAGSEDMHTCNQLLAEMDGFANNTGVVVLAATNRAFVLDRAVLRPGRFDRVLEMPLPNREGRAEILEVHGRGKKFDQNVDLDVIAKATPGFTGAELMNLMNQSGLTAIRKGREVISQADVFEALDEIQAERLGESSPFSAKQLSGTPPAMLRKRMAIFASAKALVGCILPKYHELARVSVNPSGLSSTFAHFVPQEESVETNVVDRALLDSELVVLMAGYCAEKLAFGDKNVSVLGNADVEQARALAKQMVCEYGYGKNVGMLTLPPEGESEDGADTKISATMQGLVQKDVDELLEAAEVKAYTGIARNWRLFESLTTKLYNEHNIMGGEFVSLLKEKSAFRYPDSYLENTEQSKEKIVYPDHHESAGDSSSPSDFLDSPSSEMQPTMNS